MNKKSTRISKFDRWMMAITFGEAGEAETALDLMGEGSRKTNQKQKGRKVESRIDRRPRLMA
jgi:hypothetical protein